MKATYRARSGFSDWETPPKPVIILGFVDGTSCILAIVADSDGRIFPAELRDLTYLGGEPACGQAMDKPQ